MIGPHPGPAEARTAAPSPRHASPPRDAASGAAPALSSVADVERLYRTHGHLVLRWARTILASEEDAQEALQEIFAALLRSAGAPREVRSVVGWLYGATTHHCLNLLRDRRTGARLLGQHVAPHCPAAVGARADALAEVHGLVARLPEELGCAVVYHHLAGMTFDEVAEQMGCSRRKVAYLLRRALAAAAALDEAPPLRPAAALAD